jgi:hypothetical protein
MSQNTGKPYQRLDPPDKDQPKKYLDWASAGGPNECEHGYAKGIPCPRCDKDKQDRYEPLTEAELAEIEQKLSRSAADGFMLPGTRRLIVTIRALQAENAGLKKYADHVPWCAHWNVIADSRKCNCGYDEVLPSYEQ